MTAESELPEKLYRTRAVVFDPFQKVHTGYVEHHAWPLKDVLTGYESDREAAAKSLDDFAKEQKEQGVTVLCKQIKSIRPAYLGEE